MHQKSEINSCTHTNRRKLEKLASVQLYECLECSLIFREPTEEDRHPGLLYNNFYKNELSSRFQSPVEYVVRLLRLYRALKIFTISRKAKTILDIGSGRGFLLYYLKKIFHYKRTVGIQISKPAFEFSRSTLNLEIYNTDFLEMAWGEEDTFDVITMWHVLEHVINPELYIAKIKEMLKPEGCLILEVPNFNSWTRKFTGKFWLGLDLKYHINYFSPKSLMEMLEHQGFRVTLVHTFSLEYSAFISVQSIVSRLTNTDHIFFNWLQGVKSSFPKLVLIILLMGLLTPVCLLVNLILFFTKKGEVLCMVARIDDQQK